MSLSGGLLGWLALLEFFIIVTGGAGDESFPEFALIKGNASRVLMYDPGKNATNTTNYGSGAHEIKFFEAGGDWKYICWMETMGKKSGKHSEFTCMTPGGNVSWTCTDGVSGMKIDALAGNVYWASTKGPDWQIHVTNLGNGVEGYLVAGNDSRVSALEVDENAGFMAWILLRQGAHSEAAGRTLERSSMDGSSRRVALPITIGTLTRDIALDPLGREIFLFANSAIVKVGYDGRTFIEIFKTVFHNFLSSLIYKDDYLYYFVTNKLVMEALELTDNSTTILSNITLPLAVAGISLPRLAIYRTNPCSHSNCSSLCYLSETAPYYKCDCGPGFELIPPKKTDCRLLDTFLVYASERSIYRKALENGSFADPFTLGLNYAFDLGNLAYGEKVLYWTSRKDKKIFSESIAGGKRSDVVTEQISRTSGLAVDGFGGNLFWADSETFRIEVLNLNPGKRFRKVLVDVDVHVPRGLTVDAGVGLIFWADVIINSSRSQGGGGVGRIERIALDGSGRTTIVDNMDIVSSDLTANNGFLYWWKSDGIYRCKYDGSGAEFVAEFSVETSGGRDYRLGFHADYVYWIDPGNLTLIRQKLNETRKETVIPKMERPNLRAFLFVSPQVQDSSNPCKRQRNSCQHFCLFNGDVSKEWHCSCKKDFVLESDGTTCTRSVEYNRKILIRNLIIIGLVGLVFGGLVALGGTRYYLLNRRVMSEVEYQNFLNGKKFLESVVGYEVALGEPLPAEHIIALTDIEVTEEQLGSGYFGVVYRGLWKSQAVAVKTLKDTYDNGEPISVVTKKAKCAVLIAEVKLMSHLMIRGHPNIIKFHGVELTRVKYGELLMVTELAETNLESYLKIHSSSLMERIERREVSNMMKWCGEVAGAMVHLAALGIVHEDLAARNILLFENASVAKVGDFGLARQLGNSNYVHLESSNKLPWQQLAPESWLHNKFSSASDVWAFGLLVWNVFSPGSDPFPLSTFQVDPADDEGKRRIWRSLFSSAEVSMMENIQDTFYQDVELNDLLYDCLKIEPVGRPSFEAIYRFFNPPSTSGPANSNGYEYLQMEVL